MGKTWVWNRFIERQETAAGCRAYSYVSLFGISSIRDLKRAIFNARKPFKTKSRFFGLRKVGGNAVRHIEVKPPFVGLKNTELWADSIEDNGLRDLVVCLDDLERSEPSLSISSILGFIANLRDQRNCKVVLLYNEARANKEISQNLATYREKVIDREIALQPSVKECYDLAFSFGVFALPESSQDTSGFLWSDDRSLLQIFEAVKLANIRVMRKIRTALDYFSPNLESKYPLLWPLFVRQTAKLGWLHFCNSDIHSVEKIADRETWNRKSIEAKKRPIGEIDMYAAADLISFTPEGVDPIILTYYREGYVEWSGFGSLLDNYEGELKLRLVRENHSTVWHLMWDNFQASHSEVIEAQLEFMRANHTQMSLVEISQSAEFILSFGPNVEAAGFLERATVKFVREHAAIDGSTLDTHLMPPNVAKDVLNRLNELTPVLPIPAVIQQMTESSGYNHRDVRFLQTFTAEDFYRWLANDKTEKLLTRLKEFRVRASGDKDGLDIVSRLDSALRKMADRSKVDERRVYEAIGVSREDSHS